MNREESIRFATKYLEDLLSFFGVNLAIRSTAEDDVIELFVPSSELNSLLIGKNADNLRSLQTVVSMTLASKEAELTRVNIDIADYKAQRANKIERQAEEWVKRVRDTGRPITLDLNPADRRTVHKYIEEYYSDVTTHSEGEGRERHIVIEKNPEVSEE